MDFFQNPQSQQATQTLFSRPASEICGTLQYAGLKSASMHESYQGVSGELLTTTSVREQPAWAFVCLRLKTCNFSYSKKPTVILPKHHWNLVYNWSMSCNEEL